MLAAEALRLAAIEVLCPTAALVAGSGFPTLAAEHVFDSRAAALQDLDQTATYTPTLALYTPAARSTRRGAHSDVLDTDAAATLEIIAELSTQCTEGDDTYADALGMADTDAKARLVLAALCAQVRHTLEWSAGGAMFRRLAVRIIGVSEEAHAVPQIGLRWSRVFMTYSCEVPDDDFSAGGMPEPLAGLAAALPATSYAKEKLTELAEAFAPSSPVPLEEIRIAAGVGRLPDDIDDGDATASVDTSED
ncbi:conserved hypothetical protein [uncultured Pleomorphomonas sp.]|uniref:Uncharacterized protein n=1 Tax=uncultured Pleomorphomonas sp. TaxID=442121 RepID=A0A212L783_9HYPH|nr:hypothetical protein [uncultured Pleomorphomonas sp.]SCM73380.1 conserved hypothetical protein [uncultured Pleomorphomonas sp.]